LKNYTDFLQKNNAIKKKNTWEIKIEW
jgi:hypothetical protein